MPSIEVITRGPIFNEAQRRGIMADFVRQATDDVSAQAYAEVMGNLNRSIRRPTPYYETQIINQRLSAELRRVHDRGIIYGPWLEGTGSRNRSTRFKGYASFRRAKQRVRAQVPALLAGSLARCVARLGG